MNDRPRRYEPGTIVCIVDAADYQHIVKVVEDDGGISVVVWHPEYGAFDVRRDSIVEVLDK